MTETDNMTLNEIATIRNILVGTQMQNLESETVKLKQTLDLDLEEIRTAIDNLNSKLEVIKQETNDRLTKLENFIVSKSQETSNELQQQEKRSRAELSNAFLALSKTFKEVDS